VKVDDVGAAADRVGDAGGTVLDGPLEVPGGAGSLAICQDARRRSRAHAGRQSGRIKGSATEVDMTWAQVARPGMG
jgi:hypothetical protein